MKYTILTAGCDKNVVLSQKVMAKLNRENERVDDLNDADVIYINTCSFIDAARNESLELIRNVYGKGKKIIVLGCLPQNAKDVLIREFPEAMIAGCGSYQDELNGELPEREGCGIRAYLPIADGCSRHCTYCSIPSIKGSYRSKPMEGVFREAKYLVNTGVREVTLVAQETTLYGEDLYGENKLVELIRLLSQINGLYRIRIAYAYPDKITDELLDEISGNPKVAKFLDIAMQHVSDGVLHRMGRKQTFSSLEEVMQRIRQKIPSIFIKNTFLLGFPGETENDVQILLDFIRRNPSENTGLFLYSREPGTPAYSMPGQVSPEEMHDRLQIVNNVIHPLGRSLMGKRAGDLQRVLIERYDAERNCYYGYSDYDVEYLGNKTTVFTEEKLRTGDMVMCRVISADCIDTFCTYSGGEYGDRNRKDD